VYNRQLPGCVRGTSEPAELFTPNTVVVISEVKIKENVSLTLSSIFERGPPPPSPLPKTRSDVELDSRFYQNGDRRKLSMLKIRGMKDLVVRERLGDISSSRLRIVRV
jgi:hypothetical protein